VSAKPDAPATVRIVPKKPATPDAAVARVAEVSARVEKLESSIARLESLEKSVSELSDRVRSLSEQLKTATDRTQDMGGHIETISANLASTAGYSAQRTFQCGACGSSGLVGYTLKCTSCGDENGYGWWPQGS
jgi:chromosome segregation ATPase